MLAALADDTSRLRRPLRSRDTLLMAEALRALGATITDAPGTGGAGVDADWIIEPGAVRGGTKVDCGLAGTVMRFLPAVAALAPEPVHFDGDEHARVRPMSALLEALRAIGAAVEDEGRGTLPFSVGGGNGVLGGPVTMDASASSQYVSALLLAGARYPEGITVHHDGGSVPSQPHIDMTVEALRDVGAVVDDSEPSTWHVAPGTLGALDVVVEPDLSNAGPFLAARGDRGGCGFRLAGTTQAGDALRDILDAMGAAVHSTGTTRGAGQRSLSGLDIDLSDAAELTPVAALAALADSPRRSGGSPISWPRDRPPRGPAGRALRPRVGRDGDGGRPADPPGPPARRPVPHLCRPPDGHGRRGPRAGCPRCRHRGRRHGGQAPRPSPRSGTACCPVGSIVTA